MTRRLNSGKNYNNSKNAKSEASFFVCVSILTLIQKSRDRHFVQVFKFKVRNIFSTEFGKKGRPLSIEWREEVWRDVPVARKECGFDFWDHDDDEPNQNDNQRSKQYHEILARLEAQYVENIGSDLREKASCVWKSLANGGRVEGVHKNGS